MSRSYSKKPSVELPMDTNPPLEMKFSKYIPTICATAAVGVSILALYELNKLSKEMKSLKTNSVNTELSTKMELMDQQLKKITEYIVHSREKGKNGKVKEKVIKNAVNKPEVKIINNEEYEEVEVEVTDSEQDSDSDSDTEPEPKPK